MIIFVAILVLGVLGFFIHLFVSKQPKTLLRIVRLFLLYQLVFSVGLASLLSFFGLTFLSEYVATYSGWPACPFEQLLGNVNIAFAVLGILCIWRGDDFWLATILGASIWLLGDAVIHLVDMVTHHNYAAGNVGVPLYTDILIPVVLLILYPWYQYLKKREHLSAVDDSPPNSSF